jgi:hypothetical protein
MPQNSSTKPSAKRKNSWLVVFGPRLLSPLLLLKLSALSLLRLLPLIVSPLVLLA